MKRVGLPLSFCNRGSILKVMKSPLAQQIEEIVADSAQKLNYMIYDVAIYLKGENSKISVKIDHLNGISHADCAAFSRELARRLDIENILPNYSLEVSSPGLRRELRNRADYERFIGSSVKIVYRDNDTQSVLKGTLAGIDTDSESIEVVTEMGKSVLDMNRIVRANLEFY
jgi:ribosome maturation factor RimP